MEGSCFKYVFHELVCFVFHKASLDECVCVCENRPSEKVAELCYVTTLEDMGLVRAQEILLSDSSQVTHTHTQHVFLTPHTDLLERLPRETPERPASDGWTDYRLFRWIHLR